MASVFLLRNRWGASILCSRPTCSSWFMSWNSCWNSSKLPNCMSIFQYRVRVSPSSKSSYLYINVQVKRLKYRILGCVSLTFPASRKCINIKSSSRLFCSTTNEYIRNDATNVCHLTVFRRPNSKQKINKEKKPVKVFQWGGLGVEW